MFMSAGYLKRPLYQKLGIKDDLKVKIITAPQNYFELLGNHPIIKISKKESERVDFIYLFSKSVECIEIQFFILKKKE